MCVNVNGEQRQQKVGETIDLHLDYKANISVFIRFAQREMCPTQPGDGICHSNIWF